MEKKEDDQSQCMESGERNSEESEQDHVAPKQIYLAQVAALWAFSFFSFFLVIFSCGEISSLCLA